MISNPNHHRTNYRLTYRAIPRTVVWVLAAISLCAVPALTPGQPSPITTTFVQPHPRNASTLQSPAYQPLALLGVTSAGISGTIDGLSIPTISSNGRHIAFLATAGSEEIIYTYHLGTLTPAVITGTTLSGLPDGPFDNLWEPLVNASGDLIFKGALPQLRNGLFVRSPSGQIQNLVMYDDAVAGVPNATFTGFSEYAMGDDGTVSFFGRYSGLSSGIFSLTQGILNSEVLPGDQVPGSFNTILSVSDDARVDDAGRIGGRAQLDINGELRSLIYFIDGQGSLVPVAQQGSPAGAALPGWSLSTLSGAFSMGDVNGTTQVAFRAIVTDGTQIEFAVFSVVNGQLQLLALTGQDLYPGSEKTLIDVSFPTVANNGVVYFYAKANNKNAGIVAFKNGELSSVVRAGEIAPGTGGRTFRDLGDASNHRVHATPSGDVLFEGNTGGGIRGIWWIQPNGEKVLKLLTGDELPTVAGQTQVLRNFQIWYDEGIGRAAADGRRAAVNHTGDLVFTAIFSGSDPITKGIYLVPGPFEAL